MRRTNILSSFTLWLVVIAAVLAVLEIMPVPGIIFMMLNLMLNLNVVVICLIVAAFAVDCLIGPFPRVLVAVPIIAVVGFAALVRGSQYLADRARASRHRGRAAEP